MGQQPLKIFAFFQRGDDFYTSESDVYRRQILTYKDGPRTERVNILGTKQDEFNRNKRADLFDKLMCWGGGGVPYSLHCGTRLMEFRIMCVECQLFLLTV